MVVGPAERRTRTGAGQHAPDRLSNTWIATYDTSDRVQSNTVRTVNVTVDDPTGISNSAQGSYIPPQVDITTVDTGGFPTINATVDVNTTNARSGNLGADNFSIREDETDRTI